MASGFALSSFEGTTPSLAVDVIQSPALYELGSWDICAGDLLPNRLTPLGQVSLFFENYTEE